MSATIFLSVSRIASFINRKTEHWAHSRPATTISSEMNINPVQFRLVGVDDYYKSVGSRQSTHREPDNNQHIWNGLETCMVRVCTVPCPLVSARRMWPGHIRHINNKYRPMASPAYGKLPTLNFISEIKNADNECLTSHSLVLAR